MTNKLSFDSDAYIEGIKAQIDRGTLIQSDWIVKNFRHPKNDRLPWSFEDHEFQIDIANCGDDVPVVWVEKCAQVGVSTLQINISLAFCATHDFLKTAYVLPTAKFATEFSAMRMQPAIVASPVIANLVSSETDNTGVKKIGTCFLVMRGTSGEGQAISVDLDQLIIDEMNFCNQKILSAFSSRLQHSALKLRRNFSTPTLPNFGVSKGYDGSSQGIRAVHCNHCSTWVIPDFFNDVIIPGFDKPMSMFRAGDHLHPGVQESYLSCPNCRKALDTENLNNPSKREWVHLFPNALEKGFRVRPWDVPKYNPIPEVLYSIKDYNYQDWCNFRLGIAHESAENSVVLETVRRNSVIPPIALSLLQRGSVKGTYIGSDLGKTNHYCVGVHNSELGTLDVVHIGTIDVHQLVDHHGESTMGPFLKELALNTWAHRTVVDHMPEWNTALFLHSQLPEGKAYGAYYVGANTGNLDCYTFNDKKGSVNIRRDDHFDDLVQAINAGKVRFPMLDSKNMDKMLAHLSVIKKVKETNSKGIAIETWASTSDEDHFAHALGYLWCAYASLEARHQTSSVVMPPMARGVRLK